MVDDCVSTRCLKTAWRWFALAWIVIVAAAAAGIYVSSLPHDRSESKPLEVSLDETSTYPGRVSIAVPVLVSTEGKDHEQRPYFETRIELTIHKIGPSERQHYPLVSVALKSAVGDTMTCRNERTYPWQDERQSLSLACDRKVPFDQLARWNVAVVTAT